MHVLFKTFNVGNGDCIALLLQDGEHEIHLLIDCGNYTEEVDNFVADRFHNFIDSLVVTHIDNDHIVGLINMLERKPDLTIRHIYYNSYQRTSEDSKHWDENLKANILRVMGNLPIVADMLDNKISAVKAKTLSEAILSNPEWKRVWRREYITDETRPINLDDNMGRLIFLSPTKEALNSLDHLYRRLFWEKLYKEKREDYDDEETIYEALLRSVNNKTVSSKINISSTELKKESLLQLADVPLKPITETNKASIAFIWERNEHRILFLGDASPEIVCSSLRKIYSEEKPVIFDAIKVSHHGSAENTSKELVSLADSSRYFFTGRTSSAPSINTLARIVTANLPQGIASREINYNRKSPAIEELDKDTALQADLHFTIQENTDYEFDC
jgi:beta-lactamase superfamily II metal-dependent hydrolase